MRKIVVIIAGMAITASLQAQKPVTWSYTAKKVADKTYELHLKASIEDGWHLYAQKQPDNFIGTPTAIKFNNHPLLVFSGSPKEVGALVKKKETVLDIESWEFKNDVDFVQRVTVKNDIKTNVSGSIAYQVCTDEKCLQPTTINFSIALE